MEKQPILVRNPSAVRPWQHVLECLSGYLWLGARLGQEMKASRLASAFNFGPEPAARQPVRRLVEERSGHLARQMGGRFASGRSARSHSAFAVH